MITVAVLVKEWFSWLYIHCSPCIIINSVSTLFLPHSGSGRTIVKRRKALMTIPCICMKAFHVWPQSSQRRHGSGSGSSHGLPSCAACSRCSVWSKTGNLPLLHEHWLGGMVQGVRFRGDKRQTGERCVWNHKSVETLSASETGAPVPDTPCVQIRKV